MTTPDKDALGEALRNDLLALADSKLVLANWYTTCVHNGRSLPDFAALLGMATATFGHTRALYLYLVNLGCDYDGLERRAQPAAFCSMNLLDRPPEDWEDFIATVYLAELAMWTFASGFLGHPDRPLAGLIRKIGEESYFHLKYCQGWQSIFTETGNRRYGVALAARLPAALAWFRAQEDDLLQAAGQRDLPLSTLCQSYRAEVLNSLGGASAGDGPPASLDGWDPQRRRAGTMPQRLFEIIRLKDPGAVLR